MLRFPFSVLSDVERHCLEKVMLERVMPLQRVTKKEQKEFKRKHEEVCLHHGQIRKLMEYS